jgi:hypothetical protein
MEGRWEEALTAFDGVRQVNGLGLDTRADTVEELAALLGEAGVQATAWYGVRLFTDGWTTAHLSGHSEEQALEVELQASCRDPYRLMSRLFHIISRRLQGD